jgi:hypothetical protein
LKLPHAVHVGPHVYRVRWGAANDKHWQKSRAVFASTRLCAGLVGYCDYRKKLITLHPALRSDKLAALSTLLHEVWHAQSHWLSKQRWHYADERGRKRRWKMDHRTIHMIELPQAEFMLRNGFSLRCACAPCNKPKAPKPPKNAPLPRL